MPYELILAILVLLLLKEDFKKAINEIPTQTKILIVLVSTVVILTFEIPEFTVPDL